MVIKSTDLKYVHTSLFIPKYLQAILNKFLDLIYQVVHLYYYFMYILHVDYFVGSLTMEWNIVNAIYCRNLNVKTLPVAIIRENFIKVLNKETLLFYRHIVIHGKKKVSAEPGLEPRASGVMRPGVQPLHHSALLMVSVNKHVCKFCAFWSDNERENSKLPLGSISQ